MPELRPMRADDVPAAHEIMLAAFSDLARRMHEPVPEPPADPEPAYVRLRRILATDPGGRWIAEDGSGPAGVALALLREGVWGLSLLVVQPDRQSNGIGRALLARALDYGEDARGWIILASSDARALRAYARAGFAPHPVFSARGVPASRVGCADVGPFRPYLPGGAYL